MNSTHYLNRIMGNLFKTKTSPALPAAYHIGLSSTEPTIAGAGVTEPSAAGTGYARVILNNLSEPTDGTITNTAAISFPESLAEWGSIQYYVVYDAATGGNLLFYGGLSVNRNVEINTVITIKSGELSITLSNPVSTP